VSDLDNSPAMSALHEEIACLPAVFRDPLLLHYFEGQTAEAIARRLGCPRGTALSRLSRARSRLKSRLERRGISLGMLVSPASPAWHAANPAVVQPALVELTMRSTGWLLLAKASGPGLMPTSVSSLARSVSKALALAAAGRALVTSSLILFALGSGLAALRAREQTPLTEPQERQTSTRQPVTRLAPVDPDSPQRMIEIRGRVLDAAGQPAAGARIVIDPKFTSITGDEIGTASERAISGADGRFSFSLAAGEIAALKKAGGGMNGPVCAAIVPGHGPAWLDLPEASAPAHDIELKLAADEIPIRGRLLDEQGKPLAGVSATVFAIIEQPNGNARELLRAIRSGSQEPPAEGWDDPKSCLMLGFCRCSPSARSDANGEFRLSGVGRDRIVMLDLQGAHIAGTQVLVMTTAESLELPAAAPELQFGIYRLFGPRFEVRLKPGRELTGTICDLETGERLPGIRLMTQMNGAESASLAVSDAEGRYRLSGLPHSAAWPVSIDPQGQPYFAVRRDVGVPPGNGPIALDLTLKRGVMLEGRITGRVSNLPVRARVGFFPLRPDPDLSGSDHRQAKGEYTSTTMTDYEGRFQLVVLPGPGLLAVSALEGGYLAAGPLPDGLLEQIADRARFEEFFGSSLKQFRRIDLPGSVRTLTSFGRSRKLAALTQDFSLEPGRKMRIRVDGPDGKPAAAVRPLRTVRLTRQEHPDQPGEYTYIHENPGRGETLLFLDKARQRGGTLLLDGQKAGLILLTLQPTASVSGRLVDDRGHPRVRTRLDVLIYGHRHGEPAHFEDDELVIRTDDLGRFRINGIIPGATYRVDVRRTSAPARGAEKLGYLKDRRLTFKPGETQDWGDVRPTPW
jgi:hypothetical protein